MNGQKKYKIPIYIILGLFLVLAIYKCCFCTRSDIPDNRNSVDEVKRELGRAEENQQRITNTVEQATESTKNISNRVDRLEGAIKDSTVTIRDAQGLLDRARELDSELETILSEIEETASQ